MILELDQRFLLNPSVTIPSTVAGLTGTPLILPSVSLIKAASSNPLPLAATQPIAPTVPLVQQTQQALLQLTGMSNGSNIFAPAAPGPYGLSLPQTSVAATLAVAGQGGTASSTLDLLSYK